MIESEHTGIPAVDRVIATILEEEDIEYTCCGDEVVGKVVSKKPWIGHMHR